jgi:phosphoribosylamine--glycine ligase
MGDPETEVVLPRIQNDLVDLMWAAGTGTLDKIDLQLDPRTAVTVMLVSEGYPGDFERGKVMSGLNLVQDSTLYHAGTKQGDNGEVLSNGGRVIAVTSFGSNIQEALAKSLASAELVQYDNKYYRRDIGYEFI